MLCEKSYDAAFGFDTVRLHARCGAGSTLMRGFGGRPRVQMRFRHPQMVLDGAGIERKSRRRGLERLETLLVCSVGSKKLMACGDFPDAR